MRFCPNCNSAVYDDKAVLCPECGKPMDQNVCPSCGRRLAPGEKCPHCSDCRAHGERYAVRNQSREQKSGSGELSMWAYMGLLLLAMVPVIGIVFMIVWACGVGDNRQLSRFARGVLLAKAVLFLISILFFMVLAASMQPLLEELEQWAYEYNYGDYDFSDYDDFYHYNFGEDYNYGDSGDSFGEGWPDFYGEEAPAADAA